MKNVQTEKRAARAGSGRGATSPSRPGLDEHSPKVAARKRHRDGADTRSAGGNAIAPPRHGSQTFAELRELQRLAAGMIRNPLAPGWKMQPKWVDGRPTKQVVGQFIKPNDRLTSFERLEIYNKQYWFRLLDCLLDDFPGLRAIFGDRKFLRLRRAYLEKYPSRTFALRNLGESMERFLAEEPHWAGPLQTMALDMARFEWAQVVGFDGEARPAVGVDDLLGRDPAELRLALQPYLTLLDLAYPLDDFVLAVKKGGALRSEASNAVEDPREEKRAKPVRLPKPGRIFLAVHRLENSLYYKRLEPEAYRVLCALRDGAALTDALETALAGVGGTEPEGENGGAEVDWAQRIRGWFQTWTELGWFCERRDRAKGRAG